MTENAAKQCRNVTFLFVFSQENEDDYPTNIAIISNSFDYTRNSQTQHTVKNSCIAELVYEGSDLISD